MRYKIFSTFLVNNDKSVSNVTWTIRAKNICGNYGARLPQLPDRQIFKFLFDNKAKIDPYQCAYIPLGIKKWVSILITLNKKTFTY